MYILSQNSYCCFPQKLVARWQMLNQKVEERFVKRLNLMKQVKTVGQDIFADEKKKGNIMSVNMILIIFLLRKYS